MLRVKLIDFNKCFNTGLNLSRYVAKDGPENAIVTAQLHSSWSDNVIGPLSNPISPTHPAAAGTSYLNFQASTIQIIIITKFETWFSYKAIYATNHLHSFIKHQATTIMICLKMSTYIYFLLCRKLPPFHYSNLIQFETYAFEGNPSHCNAIGWSKPPTTIWNLESGIRDLGIWDLGSRICSWPTMCGTTP